MSTLYLKGVEQAFLGNIDMEADTIKCAFMKVAYTPNAGTHQFFSDISSDVATGTTPQTLTGVDVRIDTGNSRVEFDANNNTETSVTTSTNKVVVYKDTTVASTSPLIACLDIVEGTLTTISGTLSLTFDGEGLFAINAT